MKWLKVVPALLLLPTLVACSSSSTTTSPPPPPPRLYSASSTNTDVTFYTAPFSASTTPGGSITGFISPFGVAVDPTDATSKVYIADTTAGTVAAYQRPNPISSLLFTVVSGISPGEITFDRAGNLYYTDFTTASVHKVAHPVASGSIPTALVTTGLGFPQCAAADAAGNLYVLDGGAAPHRVLMYVPPYTGAPVITTSNMSGNTDACGVDPVNNEFFVGNNAGSVLGFTTPLTTGEAPAVILTSSFNAGNGAQQFGFTFDSSGNLYIASQVLAANVVTSATISLYLGPTITSGQAAALSFPDVSISTPGTFKQAKALAIGS
jgi:streptogramin lyase